VTLNCSSRLNKHEFITEHNTDEEVSSDAYWVPWNQWRWRGYGTFT
jgi:hypothetical protein